MKRYLCAPLLLFFLTSPAPAQSPIVGPSINVHSTVPSRAHQMKNDARAVRDGQTRTNSTAPSAPARSNANSQNSSGSETAPAPEIHRSAADGRADSVKQSVESDPKLVRSTDASGFTPLHYAATGGHLDVMEVLLEAGADVNSRGSRGETPLLLAASKGKTEVVELLLEKGADVNRPGSDKRTPLHKAAMVGDLEIVKALLEGGADPTALDRSGKTAKDLAEHYRAGNYQKVVAELRKH